MRGLQLRWLLFALAVLAVRFSFAQAPTGTIAGVVTDQSGGVIANAAVTIVNKETGAGRSVISAADGSFSAPALPAGTYQLKIAITGFSTLTREAIVETGGTTTVDLKLQVGSAMEVVSVE